MRWSPKFLRSRVKKSAFVLANKPFVAKTRLQSDLFPSKFKGGLIFSADFELGWAFRYAKDGSGPEKKAAQSRTNIPVLLRFFEEHAIPATWAAVGHLFLRSCKQGDHDWQHRIPHFENKYWSFSRGDWFDCDPYTSWDKADAWYAPDLIERILESRITHEIGCHTFSHIDMSYRYCPVIVAEDEIKACVDVASEWGLTLKSFVFPGGTYGNFEALKKYGFDSYRKRLDYELGTPFRDRHDLLVIPSSSGLEDNGLGWTPDYYIRRYKRYIDKAVETQTLCHFWFHPSFDAWFLKQVFPGILKYAADKRESGDLWIGTMGDLCSLSMNRTVPPA
jgi:peptidoglycan/xylan/chitin deacetylase (PgdA/CDA1 family)